MRQGGVAGLHHALCMRETPNRTSTSFNAYYESKEKHKLYILYPTMSPSCPTKRCSLTRVPTTYGPWACHVGPTCRIMAERPPQYLGHSSCSGSTSCTPGLTIYLQASAPRRWNHQVCCPAHLIATQMTVWGTDACMSPSVPAAPLVATFMHACGKVPLQKLSRRECARRGHTDVHGWH